VAGCVDGRSDYVAEVLAGPGVPREDVWPRAAEKLLL